MFYTGFSAAVRFPATGTPRLCYHLHETLSLPPLHRRLGAIQVMLKGLVFSEMERLMDCLGEKPGRAEVLAGWLYHDRRLVRDLAETAGDDGDRSRRMGKKTREIIGGIATADGGLRLEVGGLRVLYLPFAAAAGMYCCGRAGCELVRRWLDLSPVLLAPPTHTKTGQLRN